MGFAYFSVKSLVLLLYGTFGVTCICAAVAPGKRVIFAVANARHSRSVLIILPVFAATLLLFIFSAVESFLLLDGALIAAIIYGLRPDSWRTPAALFGGLSAAVIVLSLVWWRIEPSAATLFPLGAFAITLGALVVGLTDPGERHRRLILLPVSAFIATGIALTANLGAFEAGHDTVATLVHHWGAFIGPSLHLKAGLVPFFDVPLQYGLGPSLAIAATCNGGDCWIGAELIFAGSYLASALLFLSMGLTTTRPRGIVWVCAVTVIVFAAVFLWPGFPARGGDLMAMPSSGGIRFLPVTLVALLWFFDRPTCAVIAMIPALLWSPESAAMSVAVFGLCGTAHFGFVKAALVTAALFIGSYAALFLAHRSIFGVWIDPLALIEYVIHIPGPLPINPFSDVLLLAATLGLGGWLVCNPSRNSEARRRDLAVTALLFAVASYTFGRSHPNNICNLAPFLALVALRTLDQPAEDSGAASGAALIGLAVSAAALAFSPWEVVPFDPHVVMDIHEVVAGFSTQEADVMRIRMTIPRTPALGIADFGPQFARHPAETVIWTPMDPSSLWSYVPSERRKIYIERSARRLRRSGWAIVADYELNLLDDLRTAYDVRAERSFDTALAQPGFRPTRYTVVCLDPKPQMTAKIIGPACPTGNAGGLNATLAPNDAR